jgi:hypothetical protein
MNKEYYEAKAKLCQDLAIKQMIAGETKEGGANLFRMVNALNHLYLLEQQEEKQDETR